MIEKQTPDLLNLDSKLSGRNYLLTIKKGQQGHNWEMKQS